MLSAPPQCVGTLPFPGQSKAILCKEDSILQTWYNQEHAYPNTRVVIGCIGFRAKSEPDIKCQSCGEVGVKITSYTVFGKEYSSCAFCCEPF